jgi:multidrug efflux system membrane fusion protein
MSDGKQTTIHPEERPTEDRIEPRRRHAKRRAWLAIVLLLLVAGALTLPLLHKPKVQATMGFGQRGGGPPGMGGMTLVQTAKVTAEPMNIYIDALGTVTPEHTANIYSQISGRVLAVNYSEGQLVHQGQSLIEVDPQPYEALLGQAKGALTRDRAALEQARTDAQRYEEAYKRNALAQQTVFDQQSLVKQYEGSVQNDESTIKYDEVQLSYCHITAPFSGRIGLRLVDPGNTIFAGSSNTLAVITQLDPITVVFSIAEDYLTEIQQQLRKTPTLKVELYDRAQTQKLATGRLLTLDNEIDTTTGTVKLRALFSNPNGTTLFPNQFVNARLLVKTLNAALQVPTVGIQYNGQQAFVYLLNPDSTVSIHNITVTHESTPKSAIEGLNAGQTIVTSNFDRLQDGAKVMTGPPATGRPGGQRQPRVGPGATR